MCGSNIAHILSHRVLWHSAFFTHGKFHTFLWDRDRHSRFTKFKAPNKTKNWTKDYRILEASIALSKSFLYDFTHRKKKGKKKKRLLSVLFSGFYPSVTMYLSVNSILFLEKVDELG